MSSDVNARSQTLRHVILKADWNAVGDAFRHVKLTFISTFVYVVDLAPVCTATLSTGRTIVSSLLPSSADLAFVKADFPRVDFELLRLDQKGNVLQCVAKLLSTKLL